MPGPLTLNFNWTSVGNYPAGANPWNGNPLAIAPIQTYFTPDTKPEPEEFNYLLGEIATDLANINTYLKHMPLLSIPSPFGYTTTTSGIVVPDNCFWMGACLSGAGGGGEGGNQGEVNGAAYLYPQGGGGAGAPFCTTLFPTTPGNHLKVTIGVGGAGGSAGGGAGAGGGFSRIEDTDSGAIFITAQGGAGCGAGVQNLSGALGIGAISGAGSIPSGNPTILSNLIDNFNWANLMTVAISPGAVGIASGVGERMFPFGLTASLIANGRDAPHLTSIPNLSGALYDVVRWIPPIPSRGGSVVIVGKGTLDWAQIPMSGVNAPAQFGNAGGAGGAGGSQAGNVSGNWGGCGGAGGGGGPFGPGGDGGDGGVPSASIGGHPGLPGADGASNSGAGGGGGGGGGQGVGTGGAGGAGGAGGDGYCYLFQVSGPPAAP